MSRLKRVDVLYYTPSYCPRIELPPGKSNKGLPTLPIQRDSKTKARVDDLRQ